MQAPERMERARSIAAALSHRTQETWVVEEDITGRSVGLRGPGNALLLFKSWRRPMIEASHGASVEFWRHALHLRFSSPRIGCNWPKRPAEVVAAEVERRLLPKAREWWARGDAAIAAAQRAEEERCAMVARLERFLGLVSYHGMPPTLSQFGPPVTIHAKVWTGQRVELQVEVDDGDLAVSIVEHLAGIRGDEHAEDAVAEHPACLCGPCEESQHDGHGYQSGESSSGLCHACEVAGCRVGGTVCRAAHRCDPLCPGWGVFDSDSRGLEIERCDSCGSLASDGWAAQHAVEWLLLAISRLLLTGRAAVVEELARQSHAEAPGSGLTFATALLVALTGRHREVFEWVEETIGGTAGEPMFC